MSEIREITKGMRQFSEERDWTRFHDPKSLALALVGEVGELAELLQWLPLDDIDVLVREPRLHDRLGEELADILLYLVRLSDVLGVDLGDAARAKLRANHGRFDTVQHQGKAPDRH